MNRTEFLLCLISIAVAFFGMLAGLTALERHRARKAAQPMLDRACPHCGRAFGLEAVRDARRERGPNVPGRCVSIVCPGCSRTFRFRDGELTAVPAFEVFVGDKKVGLLYEPKREEMFWCSYLVEPTSEEAEKILRDETVWNEVKFEVKARDGRRLPTFTGGDFREFCRRETDRLSFRSLWPIDS